jgi:protein involved in polysaccharide export with SLBB domain
VPTMTFDDSEPPQIGPSGAPPLDPQPLKSGAKPPAAAPSTAQNAAAANPPELPAPKSTGQKSTSGASPASNPAADTITVNLYQLMEAGNTANNILLAAGDVVTVPHAGIVYVLGAVAKPGGFVLSNDREQLSTLKILALAGGYTNVAKTDRAVIIRKDAQGQQHEVALNLKKIQNRQAEDMKLEPSDILYVPQSGAKQAVLRSVEFGIALGSGVALYRLAYH